MRVLGIEGTAWAASAALFDTDAEDGDSIFIDSDPYQPESGGIHPREAAEHMADAVPAVVDSVLTHAVETSDSGSPDIDAVAFSRGPGLGPCLRIVGTAARSLAQTLDVPLVGVNHMVAHLEIGRYQSGFDSPVCLNASGANAHLLGYHNGRYRVLGETMDTGVGNSLDKFTRHVGWTHPGGPKVERAATDGEYLDLPYVVKGMDFSFSGIMSAAKQAYDDGEDVEDICCGLQETVFGMLTEVAERALSLTGTDELVLGGGVGQNHRLREMLAEMCEERGAAFYAPDPRFLRDNAGMIAVLGAQMYEAGDTLPIAESSVDPNYRPDQVPVTWRGDDESVARAVTEAGDIRGAEATVSFEDDTVVKRRLPKSYRHPDLDERLRKERTVAEARLTSEARRAGVPTPLVRDVDVREATISFQRVGRCDLAEELAVDAVRDVGEHLGRLHAAGIVHGDPTTRNVRVGGEFTSERDGSSAPSDAQSERDGSSAPSDAQSERDGSSAPSDAQSERDGSSSPSDAQSERDGSSAPSRTFLIDFGLGFHTGHVEDHAMDLHVFEQSIEGTADDPAPLREAFEAGYAATGDADVLARLRTVEGRGRYQ